MRAGYLRAVLAGLVTTAVLGAEPVTILEGRPMVYRVGFLGCPPHPKVAWNRANLEKLKSLGFNTMQLNIAWGARPGDEPLNLEDVVELPAELRASLAGAVPLRSDQSPQAIVRRRSDLQHRIALCRELGLRTMFHFGAPYNGPDGYMGKPLHNCLLDGKTPQRYVALIEAFAAAYPGVDDLLIYTYDQDAWLCNEFATHCGCTGRPIQERVVPFLKELAATWKKTNPQGRLWWEPWELSAGQVLACVEQLDGDGFGLALHSNIAEVMAALPVDRWLKNTCQLAEQRGIPVIVETWLGGPSEELEPYLYLSHPLVTLRALKAIGGLRQISGIKEYYGLVPDKEDPNLRMTGLFFADPTIGEDEALQRCAAPYGGQADAVIRYWRLTGEAMELFPWDTSWFIREIGRCDPVHAMTGAFLRGQQCHTPSWFSTRAAIFMKTENGQPDPWMLEDVQVRCQLTADRQQQALVLGRSIVDALPTELGEPFALGLEELDGFHRRAMSYVYHLRETNLATIMRRCREAGVPIPAHVTDEMRRVLKADQANMRQDEPIASALALFEQDLERFLATYFVIQPDDTLSKGHFSLTSR